MSWLGQKITNLQNRPYAERVKILKIVIIVIVILLIGLWILTINFRNNPDSSVKSKFAPIIENFKKLKGNKAQN